MSGGHPVTLKYGVLLPHFGSAASRARVVGGAKLAEDLGFDSVWARDHIIYQPHGHEDPNPIHVDAFVTLAAIAGVTTRVKLGSAVLIPHRHPIHSALLLGSLDFIAGPGRVMAGWGTGPFDNEFAAIGMGAFDRRELIEEHVRLVRRLLSGESVTHSGNAYAFDDVQIAPIPGESAPIPMWYGGGSKAAVRRAAEYCDGWIASRMPRFALSEWREPVIAVAERVGRPVPETAVVPYVLPAKTVEEGAAKIEGSLLPLMDGLRRAHRDSGRSFETIDDLDGAVIVGPPDLMIEQVRRYQACGVTHFVFDFRADNEHFEEHLSVIGETVLPELGREG